MVDIREILYETIQEFLVDYDLRNEMEINNGLCVEFAEIVESKLESVQQVSIDYLLVDGWNGDSSDEWDEDMLSQYNQKPVNIDIEKLVYHVFIYDGNKFYDSECVEGVTNFLELPIYKRTLNG
jgi:hypothetical protein